MSNPKIYLAGKITGLDRLFAAQQFEKAEMHFQARGYDTVNPLKLPHNHDKSWSSYMLEGLAALSSCDAIGMLPNWHSSPGANIELQFAERLEKEIRFMN